MKKIAGLVTALALVLALALGACANKSSDAKQPAESKTAGATAEGQPSAAGEAYAQLQKDVAELQKAATTQPKMIEAMGETVTKLTEFIARYPGSDEAKDAKLQIAMIYTTLGQNDKSVPYLEEFIRTVDAGDERVGYAHFFLAEAYKNLDKFDEAQTQYTIFIDKYSQLNPRYLAAATSALNDIPSLKRLSIGSEPIPFTVKDTAGKEISLDKFKGKVVLLDFWATWCMPCKVEMPNVIRIHKKLNSKGFEIIGISLDSDRNAFDNYIKSNGIDWPQYFDGKGWQNGVAEKYKVRAIPATYLIDKNGKIRFHSLRGAELEKAVEQLLAES